MDAKRDVALVSLHAVQRLERRLPQPGRPHPGESHESTWQVQPTTVTVTDGWGGGGRQQGLCDKKFITQTGRGGGPQPWGEKCHTTLPKSSHLPDNCGLVIRTARLTVAG